MTKGSKRPKAEKMYRVTGFQAPLTIELPDGKSKEYNEGDKFAASEWPMAHVTIPNQVALGTIEEV